MSDFGRHRADVKSEDSFSVTLILPEGAQGWIIEKLAVKLAENLNACGVSADIQSQPSPTSDVNHFMLYHHCKKPKAGVATASITHVDDFRKLHLLRANLEFVDVGICMSSHTVSELIRQGMSSGKLCYISPAHDGEIHPRRIVIGITSKVYDDNRKRENLLVELANQLSLDLFHFEIFGSGWDRIIPLLQASGATVSYYPGTSDYRADYKLIQERIPLFDYYLYTGLDEGSLGTLDALAAGVATIITPQGFHLDIEDGITYPFWDIDQLVRAFQTIAHEKQRRIASVQQWTWQHFAHQHATLWRVLLNGQRNDLDLLLHGFNNTTAENSSYVRPFSNIVAARWEFYTRPFRRRLKRIFGIRDQ